MTDLQVIVYAIVLAAFVRLWMAAPKAAAMWVTDGDSERVRRQNDIEPYRDGEILPVIKEQR